LFGAPWATTERTQRRQPPVRPSIGAILYDTMERMVVGAQGNR
jgi:hypothetical protein